MATSDPYPLLPSIPFIYRKLRPDGSAPADGEMFIVGVAAAGDRGYQSRLVLEHGPDVLPHGNGPVTVIVVKADPTLDDMLAATIAAVRLDGRPAPSGIRPFVEYAMVLRQGLSPATTVPLERSLVGLYKAIRWKYLDLTDPVQGCRFTEDWNRLAAVIFAYAADGLDPFAEFPLPSWLFAEEQLFLAGDHNLYLRDKSAGEAWDVTIPDEGAAARRRPALLLRRPTSRLWKEWARSDPAASRVSIPLQAFGTKRELEPAGYHFLAVDEEGTGNWVFSTNPIHRLSIRSLRDRLQAEEQVRRPERAAADPWVALFDDTLVAAPAAGTAIPEAELLRLVKHWARARTVRPRRRLAGSVALAAVGCLLLAGLLGARGFATPAISAAPATSLVEQREDMATHVHSVPEQASGSEEEDKNLKPGLPFEHTFSIPLRAPQPVQLSIRVDLPDGHAPPSQLVSLTVNGRSFGDLKLNPSGPTEAKTDPQAAFLHAGQNAIRVRFPNESGAELRAKVCVAWDRHPDYKPDLYVLAVGMGHYRKEGQLPLAEKDAEALVETFCLQHGQGKAFKEVRVLPRGSKPLPLLNPTKKQLVRALEQFADAVNQAPEGAVAWVIVSGHGKVQGDGRFHLLIPGEPAAQEDDSLASDEFFAKIDRICGPVVVLLDTCESSQSLKEAATVNRVVLSQQAADWGRLVISAGTGVTVETDDWGHSALCLAVLECVTGRYQFQGGHDPDHLTYCLQAGRPFVTLEGFSQYLKSRVKQLYLERRLRKPDSTATGRDVRDPKVGVLQNPSFDLDRIAVAPGGPTAH